jgi:hypothetical protein
VTVTVPPLTVRVPLVTVGVPTRARTPPAFGVESLARRLTTAGVLYAVVTVSFFGVSGVIATEDTVIVCVAVCPASAVPSGFFPTTDQMSGCVPTASPERTAVYVPLALLTVTGVPSIVADTQEIP